MSMLPGRRRVQFSEHLYRLFLLAYPRQFREAYGREMVQTFRDCCREAVGRSGKAGLLRLWAFVLYDLTMSVCTEHVRAGITVLKQLLNREREYTLMDTLLTVDVALCTDIGLKRPSNEDNMSSVVPEDPTIRSKKGVLFVVSDGMGGHDKGEVASQITVETVKSVYYQHEDEDIASALRHAVQQANNAIYQQITVDDTNSKAAMGATCIAAVLQGTTVYIANVGDSRAYIVRGGQAQQLTQDHSWVAEQVQAGLLTEEQARTHEKRNIITRCLGTEPNVEVDLFTQPVQEGDILVLCTDGLSGLISADELVAIVEQYGPEESASRLIACANEHGGPDNITAIVARVGQGNKATS